MNMVSLGLKFLQIYLLAGCCFAIFFVVGGLAKIDPSAKSGSKGFRLAILPGITAFWPLFVWRWLSRATKPPLERNAHRDLADQILKERGP